MGVSSLNKICKCMRSQGLMTLNPRGALDALKIEIKIEIEDLFTDDQILCNIEPNCTKKMRNT